MDVRAADHAEIDHLAKLWYDGWQDAHARIMPAELARYRTLESFRHRLEAALPTVRVSGLSGQPTGFCMVKDDELYQLYVAASVRGSGVAAALLADALERTRQSEIASYALVVDAKDEEAAAVYRYHGFIALADARRILFLPIATWSATVAR